MPMAFRQRLTGALRRGCPGFVADALAKGARFLHPDATFSYAREGEDLVLRGLRDDRPNGFYVDVGAHHPSRYSNTLLFYHTGWRGINIEPAPAAVDEFNRTRPRDVNINLGAAEQPAQLTYYVFSDPALNTFDEALMNNCEARTPYRVVDTRKVAVERLDRILNDHLPTVSTSTSCPWTSRGSICRCCAPTIGGAFVPISSSSKPWTSSLNARRSTRPTPSWVGPDTH
jgi:hypothetical protein